MISSVAEDVAVGEDKIVVVWACGAALAWMIWDTLIHLDIEMQCIWNRPNSWLKWMYAFIRYAPTLHLGIVHVLFDSSLSHFSSEQCRAMISYELGFLEVLTFAVETILAMRLLALYNDNRVILWVMMTLFLLEIIGMTVVLVFTVPQQTFTSSCHILTAPPIFVGYWLASLVFETFLFALTLFKFCQNMHRRLEVRSIVFVLFRDGTWAFAVIFVCMLLNMLMYQLNHNPLSGMGYAWTCGTMSLSGSHVLLNIRRIGISDSDYPFTATQFTSIIWGTQSRNHHVRTAAIDEKHFTEVHNTDTGLEELPDSGQMPPFLKVSASHIAS